MSSAGTEQPQETKPINILIVDDSPEDLAVVRRQLRSLGPNRYAIREALSAKEGLRECAAQIPDCLLLDIRMPELDGIGFLRRLRDAGFADFPVLMLTSIGDSALAATALQLGAQDFLLKGQTTSELLRRSIEHARERFRIAQQLAKSNECLSSVNTSLSENLQRLQAIFSQTTLGIAQATLTGHFTLANHAFLELTGRTPESIGVTNLQDLPAEIDQRSSLPNSEPADTEREVQYRKPDGRLLWVHETVTVVCDEQGLPTAKLVVIIDITARKAAERDQALLASIAEACVDAVIYLDLEGIIRTWNRGSETTYGYSASEAIGQPFTLIVPENKLEEWESLKQAAAEGRPVQGFETERLCRNGQRLPVSHTFSAVRDTAGELTGFCSIGHDISRRKRSEASLRASEMRYRTLANAMPQIVYVTDARGETKFLNEQWTKYTGMPESEALGSKWLNVVHPEDREANLTSWTKAVHYAETFEIEHRLRRADGEYCWHLSRAFPVKDADGTVTGWNGTSTNINDQKTIEANLRISEERLRLAQASAGVTVWDLDLRRDRYTESPEFYEQFEFDPGQAVTFADWLERIHPDDRASILSVTQDPAQSSHGLEIEFRVPRANGDVRWLLGKGSTILDSAGRPVRVTGINIDITARKNAEAELAAGRERLSFALHAARMGIWEWHIPEDTIHCSSEISPLFGGDAHGLCLSLESFLSRVHPDERSEITDELRAACSRKKPFARELRLVHPNGSILWLELQGAVIRGSAGEPLRMIGTARDITEKKTMEAKLADAEKFRSIGVLAAGLAHDFNNLLTVVIGSASLANEVLPQGHDVSNLLNDVMRAGERAALLTAQMLAYSGKGQVRHDSIDMPAIAKEAIANWRKEEVSPTIEFTMDVEPNLNVTGDPGQIRQVIGNVLTNAAEALGTDTRRVALRIKRIELHRDFIEAHLKDAEIHPGAFVKIEISDTGCGIPDELRKKIFEPFFTTKFMGRGLGLAAVAGIVRSHNGAILLDTEPGKGTTVSVFLPLRTQLKAPRPVHAIDTPTILIVDDEAFILEVASRALARTGFRTLVASGGTAALEILNRRKDEISLVLLDLTMPGLSGDEVVRRMRKMNCRMPVVLSSGYSEQDALDRISTDEVDGFLQKPYTSKALVEKVRGIVGRASSIDRVG